MKKNILVVAFAVLLAGAGIVCAEEMKGGMMEGKGGMMGKGMMGGKGMHGGMMESMMKKSMVATSDGGVIVLTANKLIKYDKDLNVVKEVEIKAPTMEEMEKMCPMMGKGMGMGMMGDGPADKEEAAAEGAESAGAPASDEHSAHH